MDLPLLIHILPQAVRLVGTWEHASENDAVDDEHEEEIVAAGVGAEVVEKRLMEGEVELGAEMVVVCLDVEVEAEVVQQADVKGRYKEFSYAGGAAGEVRARECDEVAEEAAVEEEEEEEDAVEAEEADDFKEDDEAEQEDNEDEEEDREEEGDADTDAAEDAEDEKKGQEDEEEEEEEEEDADEETEEELEEEEEEEEEDVVEDEEARHATPACAIKLCSLDGGRFPVRRAGDTSWACLSAAAVQVRISNGPSRGRRGLAFLPSFKERGQRSSNRARGATPPRGPERSHNSCGVGWGGYWQRAEDLRGQRCKTGRGPRCVEPGRCVAVQPMVSDSCGEIGGRSRVRQDKLNSFMERKALLPSPHPISLDAILFNIALLHLVVCRWQAVCFVSFRGEACEHPRQRMERRQTMLFMPCTDRACTVFRTSSMNRLVCNLALLSYVAQCRQLAESFCRDWTDLQSRGRSPAGTMRHPRRRACGIHQLPARVLRRLPRARCVAGRRIGAPRIAFSRRVRCWRTEWQRRTGRFPQQVVIRSRRCLKRFVRALVHELAAEHEIVTQEGPPQRRQRKKKRRMSFRSTISSVHPMDQTEQVDQKKCQRGTKEQRKSMRIAEKDALKKKKADQRACQQRHAMQEVQAVQESQMKCSEVRSLLADVYAQVAIRAQRRERKILESQHDFVAAFPPTAGVYHCQKCGDLIGGIPVCLRNESLLFGGPLHLGCVAEGSFWTHYVPFSVGSLGHNGNRKLHNRCKLSRCVTPKAVKEWRPVVGAQSNDTWSPVIPECTLGYAGFDWDSLEIAEQCSVMEAVAPWARSQRFEDIIKGSSSMQMVSVAGGLCGTKREGASCCLDGASKPGIFNLEVLCASGFLGSRRRHLGEGGHMASIISLAGRSLGSLRKQLVVLLGEERLCHDADAYIERVVADMHGDGEKTINVTVVTIEPPCCQTLQQLFSCWKDIACMPGLQDSSSDDEIPIEEVGTCTSDSSSDDSSDELLFSCWKDMAVMPGLQGSSSDDEIPIEEAGACTSGSSSDDSSDEREMGAVDIMQGTADHQDTQLVSPCCSDAFSDFDLLANLEANTRSELFLHESRAASQPRHLIMTPDLPADTWDASRSAACTVSASSVQRQPGGISRCFLIKDFSLKGGP